MSITVVFFLLAIVLGLLVFLRAYQAKLQQEELRTIAEKSGGSFTPDVEVIAGKKLHEIPILDAWEKPKASNMITIEHDEYTAHFFYYAHSLSQYPQLGNPQTPVALFKCSGKKFPRIQIETGKADTAGMVDTEKVIEVALAHPLMQHSRISLKSDGMWLFLEQKKRLKMPMLNWIEHSDHLAHQLIDALPSSS